MARAINRLTSIGVRNLKEPGLYADGGGLYLRIDQTLARRWVWVFFWRGKRREMGLGSAATTELKDARKAAEAARQVLAAGLDPIADRKQASQPTLTFGDLAERVIAEMKPSWKNPITAKQWTASLDNHAAKLLKKAPADITAADVLDVLRPIWQTRRETATRVRARIEHILDVAKLEGRRTGENPAIWKGNLALYLGGVQAADVEHHPALPYEKLQAFLGRLRGREATAARAMEFVILSATRSAEARLATWAEIDADLWTVPKERMKGGREHRVPITGRMREILEEMAPLRTKGDFIFPGDQRIEPISSMAMPMLLRRMKCGDITVHGFRSTFRDWAGDCTTFAREVVEEALAHVVGSTTERAYRRRDALEKRRDLMVTWATFCTTLPDSNVKPFKKPA